MKLVKEHINFERGLDPKDAMRTGSSIKRLINKTITPNFYSQKKTIIQTKLLDLFSDIIKDPEWDGEINYINSLYYDIWTDGTHVIEFGIPYYIGSRGKELKRLLKEIGLKPIGQTDTFTRGDYRYYQIPIEPPL